MPIDDEIGEASGRPARSILVSTRCCSDKNSLPENEKQPETKKEENEILASPKSNEKAGKKKKSLVGDNKSENKLFSILLDEKKKTKAINELNLLLNNIRTENEKRNEDQLSESKINKVNVPKAQKRFKKKKSLKNKTEKSKELSLLIQSAEEVAEQFEGDVKQTKSDLLNKIHTLLDKVTISPTSSNLENLIMSMDSVEKETPRDKSLDLYSNESHDLKIFSVNFKPSKRKQVQLKIWDELQKDELKSLISTAPANYYEELIDWTEQGKLWHFPIDNEQGLNEEAKVDFTEHVFLENQLEPWCPKSGPLRHFMELVISGLSKNPYLTVQDKHEHIHWFRDYFEGKKKLLLELGAYDKKSSLPKN